jgi:hypothetical protein
MREAMLAPVLHFSVLTILAAGLLAQAKPQQQPAEDQAQAADLQSFGEWLKEYRAGAHRFYKNDKLDEEAIARTDALFGKLAQWNTLAAARALFEAACFQAPAVQGSSASNNLDYLRELQPWRVQSLACNHLRTMTGEGILPWLLQKLSAPGIRAGRQQEMVEATAVLRTLGGHKSVEAQLALLKACSAMPTELRVHAVNAMAKGRDDGARADLDRDVARRRAERAHRRGERDRHGHAASRRRVARQETDGRRAHAARPDDHELTELLIRDQIWQVRSAAAFSLASMKCKPVVPALISGLDAELKRKKDPWAMDLRLHRLLEGLTQQRVVFGGGIAMWQDFWNREGPTFNVKPPTKAGEAEPKNDKYQKFFNLQVESDRVLFVVDFSGSMAEPLTLKSGTAAVRAGETTTKAAIVVSELKKLIMSMPDGALINPGRVQRPRADLAPDRRASRTRESSRTKRATT